jgi:uncharacterized LabA/DUF88 family protein
MEKVYIIIDASNFYHLVLKKLGIQSFEFDFDKFAYFLAYKRTIVKHGKRYYVATVREKNDRYETKKAMSNQTSLFSRLWKANWEIKSSKLKTRIETVKIDNRVENYQDILKKGVQEIIYERSREKGIDVKMAVDLIIDAKKYDTAILVSSDTDLVPALDLIRFRFKKRVEYIGFSIPKDESRCIDKETKPIARMIEKTDALRGLVESDIEPFIIKEPKNESLF